MTTSGITTFEVEQARNPYRSAWEILQALEARDRIAAGEYGDQVVIMAGNGAQLQTGEQQDDAPRALEHKAVSPR